MNHFISQHVPEALKRGGRLGVLLLAGLFLALLTGVPPRSLLLFLQLSHISETNFLYLFLVGLQMALVLAAYGCFLVLLLLESRALVRAALPEAAPPATRALDDPIPQTHVAAPLQPPLSLLLSNPYEEVAQQDPSVPGEASTNEEDQQERQEEPVLPSLPIDQHRDVPAHAPDLPANASPPPTIKKGTPLERLEAFYQQQKAQGTPLERMTIDLFRTQTHVKRETIGAFLRQKRAEAASDTLSAPEREAHPADNPMTPPVADLQAASVSHPGLKRASTPNEDTPLLVLAGERGLFAVADGMGGHGQGDVASQHVVAHLQEQLVPLLTSSAVEEHCRDQLAQCVQEANQLLYQKNQEQGTLMGTTLTAAIVVGSRAYIVNVGDSRTYWQSRQHGLIQITKDHSIVQSLIEQERITEQARYLHPQRNQITRCLGHEPQIALDAFLVTLEPGDRLLLCSDGLWEMIPDEEHLARLLAQEKALQAICDDLLSAALAGGGRDNVSALLVQLAPGPVQH